MHNIWHPVKDYQTYRSKKTAIMKRISIETHPEQTQMLELEEKENKIVIITVFHMLE